MVEVDTAATNSGVDSTSTTPTSANGSGSGQQPRSKSKKQKQQQQQQQAGISGSDGDVTVPRSGNSSNNKKASSRSMASGSGNNNTAGATTTSSGKKKKKRISELASLSPDDQLAFAREQVQQEKAGKRKLFHSLVKLANELRRTRLESVPLVQQRNYADKTWYEGGIWRAPALLPGVYHKSFRTARLREAISLTDLFFGLTIVTAFTRVGVAISKEGFVDVNSLLYFAVFWTVWSKEASYSTRFDTTDLSAQAVTLVNCLAVLFASLSVQEPIHTVDGTRIMIMAAFVAALHLLLYIRVLVAVRQEQRRQQQEGGESNLMSGNKGSDENNNNNDSDNNNNNKQVARQKALQNQVMTYAIFSIVMCSCELTAWLVGVLAFSPKWPYRWLLFVGGIVLAQRIPRAVLPNDFHAACSKRGVLFILLLGFLLQSIVVVASEFFTYQTPTLEQYAFVGAACLMLFCMKLLYADDSDILAEDHAYLINRTSAFFFNMGQFVLLLSTTILGSGLNLLTHDYLAATQALPGPSKSMVCGGFSAVLFATFFIKSMHLKRVPADGRGQCLFVAAYLIQTAFLLAVVAISAAMAMGKATSGALAALMESDILLLFALSGAALVVVLMHWLDEGVELALYGTSETGRTFRIHPFGFWWCLKPEETEAVFDTMGSDDFGVGSDSPQDLLFSELSESSITSPLLAAGSSGRDYRSTATLTRPGSGELV